MARRPVFITAETTSSIDRPVHQADFLSGDTEYVDAALPPLIIDVDGGTPPAPLPTATMMRSAVNIK